MTVGEPVTFEARIISSDSSYAGTLFHWAFGDGTEWNGISAVHAYEYPGDYIVVVEASRFGASAVAEARVKVVAPEVAISSSDADSIVISNNGADEINLGGWVITDAIGRFIVPEDTIISSHSFITVPASVMKTKVFSGTVSLYDQSEKEIATASVGAAAISGGMAIVLPDGMTAVEFSKDFSAAVTASSTGHYVAETKAKARPAGGQAAPLLANTEAATAASSSQSLASSEASSSAAAVIYTIPRQSPQIFSGIASWFGGLFGKK